MKTRHSLVSNSSSTSFCIYGHVEEGFRTNAKTIYDVLKNIQKNFSEQYQKQLLKLIETWKAFPEDKYSKRNIKKYTFLLNIQENEFSEYFKTNDDDIEILYDLFTDLCGSFKLRVYSSDYSTYVGRSYMSLGDDETGKQFKDSVNDVVPKIFPNAECDQIMETISS